MTYASIPPEGKPDPYKDHFFQENAGCTLPLAKIAQLIVGVPRQAIVGSDMNALTTFCHDMV